MKQRLLIIAGGVVQGIGMRPFVYRLATEHSLVGEVRNDGGNVVVEVQGNKESIAAFVNQLLSGALPKAGRIDFYRTKDLPIKEALHTFRITNSSNCAVESMALCADRAVCDDCLREMNAPDDRRRAYPFINCTACGPRFTITRRLPYDRSHTTMAKFPMCEDCRREYEEPLDRRYHAEPIACPRCGPSVWLTNGMTGNAAIREAARRLVRGEVVAVKGIGGFHLAANARNSASVKKIRVIKRRPRKPLALMVRDMSTARSIALLDSVAEELLCSPAAPIILAPKRQNAILAPEVAPHLADVGLMLPYTPLHHLLLQQGPDALVMTSLNLPGEPIATRNSEALQFSEVDIQLLHNREIHVAADDSVLRAAKPHPLMLRRSRGYVPEPLRCPQLPQRRVLALGAEWRVTISSLNKGSLIVGRHLGNLATARAGEAFRDEVRRILDFTGFEPEVVAVDLHPDFASTLFAEEELSHLPLIRVQHHHAHLASVLVENGIPLEEDVAGIVLDGFGLGADKTIWGGEILMGSYQRISRFGHLRPVPQPGGDRAALEPARMAISLLLDAGIAPERFPFYDDDVAQICENARLSPPSSSAGRLLDGAAAILGLAPRSQEYEGEAPSRMESIADPSCNDAYPLPNANGILDTRCLINALVADRSENAIRAARFHNGLADGLCAVVLESGLKNVALAGGCMVNRILFARLVSTLEKHGVRVLTARKLPPGDGGISAGQTAVAACPEP
jgi:hydrogenase maturation protein HypF